MLVPKAPPLLCKLGEEDHRHHHRMPTAMAAVILRSWKRLSDNAGVNEQTTIEIAVNSELRRIAAESSVSDLVALLELSPQRLAIELNLFILPRAAWAETRLQNGDKLEIVHFVGGG